MGLAGLQLGCTNSNYKVIRCDNACTYHYSSIRCVTAMSQAIIVGVATLWVSECSLVIDKITNK